uniref:SusC/RagA family TonB-linked outer membrane protein n=1 Tax=Mariniphaga sediminis TaxID=1628158 RepID=UPI00356729DE
MKKKTNLWYPGKTGYRKVFRIMRISLFLVLISTLQILAENGYSQSTPRLTLDMKNATIKDVLFQIENQSGFYFLYDNSLIDVHKKVDVIVQNEQIDVILNKIFGAGKVNANIKDRHIVLTPAGVPVTQQTHKVSGTVTDSGGSPLPGVTVVIKGTTQGTVTNADGKYTLANVPDNATLVFSFVGMRKQEVVVGDQTSIDIVMEQETIGIDEVVAIGYGTMRKSDLTGSVVSADIEAFRESQNVNIIESLHGSVAGLNIGQTNRAGQEVSIQVRGVNTLSGNKNPLIVVDEIIYSGRISDLNPSDIKSVDVLKDASSKAIYGSQAANGVILITTKSGRKNEKPTFNYSGAVAFQSPTVKARLLNREEILEKVKGICYTDAYLAPDYTEPNPGWNWGQSEFVPNLLQGIEDGTDYDWWDALTSPGLVENHVLTMSGGMEKTSYYISGGYTSEDGFVMNDNYKRYTTRINFKNEIKNWLTLGINTFGSFSDLSGKSPNYNEISYTSPLVTPYDDNGNFVIYPKGAGTTNLNPMLYPSSDDKNVNNKISGIFYIDVKIPKIEGLAYRINYNQSLDWRNFASSSEYGAGLTGSAYKTHISQHESTLDNIVSYKKELNHHRINATLVYGYRKAEYGYTKASGENISNINLSYNSLQQAITQRISSSAWEEASLYQMARINYNYKDRYLVTGTLRRDGFSGFAKNNKFGYFPSVAMGWVLSNEPL